MKPSKKTCCFECRKQTHCPRQITTIDGIPCSESPKSCRRCFACADFLPRLTMRQAFEKQAVGRAFASYRDFKAGVRYGKAVGK